MQLKLRHGEMLVAGGDQGEVVLESRGGDKGVSEG